VAENGQSQVERRFFYQTWLCTPRKGSASGVGPEEFLSGDEVERLIKRHDDRPEGAGQNPSIAPPLQDLHVVAPVCGPQARDFADGVPAAERAASVRPHYIGAVAWPGVGGASLARGDTVPNTAPQ